MTMDAERRPATLADLLARDEALEIIDGELVQKAQPSFRHGSAQTGLGGALYGFRGPGGGPPDSPGGWWLASEVDVLYADDQIFRHDLAGWRRARVESAPDARPVREKPDWVCEVLSPSNASNDTAANDTVKKPRVLQRERVPYYWLLDPEHGTLRALRWTEDGYLEVASAVVGEKLRAEPFDAVELDLAAVLGNS